MKDSQNIIDEVSITRKSSGAAKVNSPILKSKLFHSPRFPSSRDGFRHDTLSLLTYLALRAPRTPRELMTRDFNAPEGGELLRRFRERPFGENCV